jgi:Ca2+:H+ antiporter
VLQGARAEAHRLGHGAVGTEHILLALLAPDGPGGPVLARLGLDPESVRERLAGEDPRPRERGTSEELAYTSHAQRLIENASREARVAGVSLTARHLLGVGLREPRGTMGRILAEAGISAARVDTALALAPPAGTHGGAAGRGWLSWRAGLLLALPVSILLGYLLHAPAVWVFVTACLGVLPLAGYMGEATEHLAHRTGPTIGGLLNATFGNAAELIIAIVALRAGLVQLVKASITGSILGNLLLILGLALIAGGLNRAQLRFNRVSAGMSAGMLALAVVALVFPALYHSLHPEAAARLEELRMSEAVSVILLATYGCSLLFTLKTHRRLFGGEAHPLEGPVWSVRKAVLILGGATIGVAVESELLVHAATPATETLGLSPIFLGLIVIPIIGNAAEHAAAVVLSRKGQIDLGLQIALGSSTQVALLVAPILVFAGVLLGQDMNLVFTPFEVLALGMATVVAAIITLDGESHWFEGVQLLAVYAMVAIGAFFL